MIEAINNAGSVFSGISSFVLANVPGQPDDPINDITVTNDYTIKVNYGTSLPDNRGSPITSLWLQMDDGLGGDFVTLIGLDYDTL